ncbi:MAG: HDIG domain-containing protein [Lachnospiraceae bacterium]|nr:HDIG domain-containing protein [Lachnospiraceae bacterium]
MKVEDKRKLLSIITTLLLTVGIIVIRCFGFELWNNQKIYILGILFFMTILCIFVIQDKLEWNQKNSLIFLIIWTVSIIFIVLTSLTGINEWFPYFIPVIMVTIMYGIDSGFCFNIFITAFLTIIWEVDYKNISISTIIKFLLIGTILIISLKFMKNITQIIFTGMSVLFATGIINILYYNLILDKVDIKALFKGFLIIGITYTFGFFLSIWKKINYKEETSNFEKADVYCSEEFEAIRNYKEKAPDSYMHAISVSELAFIAANKVNADVGIIRIGAIYHEIGKSENQSDYVNAGIEICDKYDLPDYVKNIITEHCLKIRNPKTIESAIIMLADSVINSIEYAKTKSQTINNKKTIENVMKVRLESGALDSCNMTIDCFNRIKKAFLDAY